jgi:hypothetical protein
MAAKIDHKQVRTVTGSRYPPPFDAPVAGSCWSQIRARKYCGLETVPASEPAQQMVIICKTAPVAKRSFLKSVREA